MTTQLERLQEHARITQAVFDDYWMYTINHSDPINWPIMESMADRANRAANEVTEAYTVTKVDRPFTDEEIEIWETSCSCSPLDDAYLCAACIERNCHKYGDDIPYGSDEWFKLQDMKDNTDTEGRE